MRGINYKQAKTAWLAKQGKYPISSLSGASLKLYKTKTFRQIKHLYNKLKKEDKNEKY